MRRGKPFGGLIGFLMIVVGVLIILAMMLPAGFWWFIFGAALIVCGFCCANRH